mmetsp:Transcript_29640/g.85269  ORF Transcript_29640/g.85269 Transcript_29640/m.85269 type:complete len:94 (-) Transcript_29640:1420-1701(-)
MSPVLIFGRKRWNALETSPTNAENQRIVAFQDLLVPSMLLEATTNKSKICLLRGKTPKYEGMNWIKTCKKRRRDAIYADSAVKALPESLVPEA